MGLQDEKKIRQALDRPTSTDSKKRRRSDASLSHPNGARKSHNSSQGRSRRRRESGGTSTSSTSSRSCYRNPQPGPSKMLKIHLKLKCCQQPGAGNKTAKASTSPRKAGRHRRPSTASSGPSDGSGRQPRMSSQGEVRVTVPNDVDPLRDGPIDRRLTWKNPVGSDTAHPSTSGPAHLGQPVRGHRFRNWTAAGGSRDLRETSIYLRRCYPQSTERDGRDPIYWRGHCAVGE